MADIERLDIIISAEASKAEKQLNKLMDSLGKLSKALNGLNTSGLTGLANSVQKLSSAMQGVNAVKTADFTRLANNIQKLAGINRASLNSIASSITILGKAMSSIGNVSTNAIEFERIASALSKLGGKKVLQASSVMPVLSKEIPAFVSALNSSGAITFDAAAFESVARGVSKLGGANVKKALQNIPLLTKYLPKFSTCLNSIGTINYDTSGIVNIAKAISKLGGKNVKNAITNIPQVTKALRDMMRTLQSAPRVSNNLIRMTEAMARLSSNGNRVGSTARSLGGGFRSYGRYADTATKKTKNLASAIGMLYAKFWIFQRAFSGLFKSIEKSMDFSETVNYFEVAMRKIGDDAARNWQEEGYNSAESYAESFAKRSKELTAKMTGFDIDSDGNAELTNQKNLGLDPDKVLQYQAQYAQMADSIGMTEEAALNTSKALTMLGTDWASLRNISFDQAWEKFASALAGQSRAVRSLGIDITQATLQEYAYKYGLDTMVSEMNQATKAQLRLLAILDQSKVAFGDLANTIQSPANQLRMLQQNLSNLARMIGNIFLPVVAKALPYINGIVIAMQRLFQWIGKLLGIKMTNINTSMGGMSDSISDLIDSGDDGIGGIADDAGNASDALNSANDSAKKLKRTILGFDELNVLNDNSDDSSSKYNPSVSSGSISTPSIGGSALLDSAIADALAEYEKAWNDAFDRMENKAVAFADELTASFKKLWKVAEPTRKAIKKLWDEGLAKLAKFTWTALKDFYGEFLVPVGKWALGKGIPELVNATNDFLNKINWSRINTSLKEFWKALAPFATNVGEGLIEFYRDLTSVGADFINKVVPGGLDALAKSLKNISPEQAQKIGYGLGILFTSITAFKGITWIGSILGAGSPLAKGLELLSKHPYTAMAVGIAGVVIALDKFGVIDVDWDWIWSRLDRLKNILSDFIGNVDISSLSNSISNLWTAFQPFAHGFADGLIGAFDILVNDIGAPLISGLAKAFEKFTEVLAVIPPEHWENVGFSLGVIVAAKITKDFISKVKLLADAFGLLKTVLAGGKLASLLTAAGNAASASSVNWEILSKCILTVGSAFLGVQIGMEMTKKTLNGSESDFNNASLQLANFTSALAQLAEQGTITGEQQASLNETVSQLAEKGASPVEIMTTLRDALMQAGVSSDELSSAAQEAGVKLDELSVSLRNAEGGATVAKNNLDSVKTSASNAGEKIGDLSSKAQESSSILNAIDYTPVKTNISGIQDSIDGVNFNKLATNSETAITNTNNVWNNGKKSILDAVKGALVDNITLDDLLKEKYTGYAAFSVEGYNQKIRELEGTTKDTMGNFAQNAIMNPFTSKLGIHSPSRVFGEYGENIVAGLTNKINDKAGTALDAMKRLGDKLKGSLDGSLSNIESSTDRSMDNLGRSFDSAEQRAYSASSNIVNAFSNIHIPLPHIDVGWDNWNVGTLSFSVPRFNLNWYANGGFPNAGELFMANEAGPELVGKMGNRNVVANNKQITDGIKAAVVEGMTEVMMAASAGQNDDKAYILNVTVKTEDNEVLARAVEKGKLKRDYRYNPFSAY